MKRSLALRPAPSNREGSGQISMPAGENREAAKPLSVVWPHGTGHHLHQIDRGFAESAPKRSSGMVNVQLRRRSGFWVAGMRGTVCSYGDPGPNAAIAFWIAALAKANPNRSKGHALMKVGGSS